MAKHMREVIGVTPRAVRRQVRPWEFVDTLATWLCPSPGLANRVASRRATPFASVAPGWDRPVHALADVALDAALDVALDVALDAAPAADAPRGSAVRQTFDASWLDHPPRAGIA
jgi:hypothetical protein